MGSQPQQSCPDQLAYYPLWHPWHQPDIQAASYCLCHRHDHLLHSIFSCFQDVLGAFGRIMLESDVIPTASAILSNDASPLLAAAHSRLYLHPYEVFLRSRTRLSNLVNDQLMGDLIGPLGSYTIIHPPQPSTKQVTKADDGTKPSRTKNGSKHDNWRYVSINW